MLGRRHRTEGRRHRPGQPGAGPRTLAPGKGAWSGARGTWAWCRGSGGEVKRARAFARGSSKLTVQLLSAARAAPARRGNNPEAGGKVKRASAFAALAAASLPFMDSLEEVRGLDSRTGAGTSTILSCATTLRSCCLGSWATCAMRSTTPTDVPWFSTAACTAGAMVGPQGKRG